MAIEKAISSDVGHFDDGVVARAWVQKLGERTPSNKGNNQRPVIQAYAAIFMLGKVLHGEPVGTVDLWNRWVPEQDTNQLKLTTCRIDFNKLGTTKKVMSFISLLSRIVMKDQYQPVAGRMLDRLTLGELI